LNKNGYYNVGSLISYKFRHPSKKTYDASDDLKRLLIMPALRYLFNKLASKVGFL